MRPRIALLGMLSAAVFAISGGSGNDVDAGIPQAPRMSSARPARSRATEILASLPAGFDANVGQFDDRVRFVAQAGGIVAWLVDGEVVVKLGEDDPGRVDLGPRSRAPTKCGGVLRMRFPSSATPRGQAKLAPTSNWFLGNDPKRWRTDVASFGRARYESVAPGVDVVWRGTRRALEYDVVVAPGADLAAFSIAIDGASSLRVDARSGDLVVTTPLGAELRQSHPRCFQTIDGARRDVAGRFVVDGARVSFAVAEWDRSRELVIDPTLDYSTYLGGSGQDWGFSVAAAPTGDLVVAGRSASTNFPLVSAQQSSYSGSTDGFLTRIKADGTGPVFSTYIGGSGSDYIYGVCLNAAGDLFVAGTTSSSNLPVASAFQSSFAGGLSDAFIAKLPFAGNQLTYCTYLGGSGDDDGQGVTADASGSAYVVGRTVSSNFPLANPRQSVPGGGASDAFVTKLTPAGSGIVYSTFHGGNFDDQAYGCALDATGALVVVGLTLSTNFPTKNAFQSTAGGYADGWVSKFNGAGNALVFSTYLDGNGADYAFGVAVDPTGAVIVCGETQSTNFPTASPTQAGYGGGQYDGFVTKFQPSGTALAFSTFIGGSGADGEFAVGLDPSGGIVLVGNTSSTDFPVVKPLQASNGGGTHDVFVARYSPGTPTVAYATYLGGSGDDIGYGAVVDASGNVCFSGMTVSTDFPVRSAYQSSSGGGTGDAIVVRLAPTVPAAPTSLTASLVGTSTAHLAWSDTSSDETSFEVQRRLGSGPYTTYASLAPGSVVYDDTSLFASTTYTYRVRAVGVEGPSAFTNEASVVTPVNVPYPPMPHAPDGLEALVVSPNEVDLTWRDRSNDEIAFEVQRAAGGAPFATLHTMPQNVVAFADDVVLPGWPVGYRIRALAVQGPSVFSATVTATTAASMTLTTSAGLVVDSAKPKKDKVTWKGTFAFTADPPPATIDPKALGVRFQAGPVGAPVAVTIAAGDARWKVAKKRTFTWTTAKGVSPKVTLVLNVVKMTYSLAATGFDYTAPADTSERLLFALGADAGALAETWVARKLTGSFAPPKN